ncbi:hypothetical protein [Geodermatophilus siccatus]|nr:hypothetical protein [Geodermatophilus siccatus]
MRTRATRAALVALIVVAGLLALPGTASATGTVVPLLDCVVTNRDGSWTAVFGYRNTASSPVRIPAGPRNKVTPVTYGAPQPITFQPGTHRGAFTVTVSRGAGPMWHLDGTNLAARLRSATACPPSTQMPAEGNGTGTAIALMAAGLVGAMVVQRARRRAPAGLGGA